MLILDREIRDGIREQLMDARSLEHLEACGSINYSTTVQWQYRPISGGEWSYLEGVVHGKVCRPDKRSQLVCDPLLCLL